MPWACDSDTIGILSNGGRRLGDRYPYIPAPIYLAPAARSLIFSIAINPGCVLRPISVKGRNTLVIKSGIRTTLDLLFLKYLVTEYFAAVEGFGIKFRDRFIALAEHIPY